MDMPNPSRWPIALQAIADCLDDVGVLLVYQREDGGFGALGSSSLPALSAPSASGLYRVPEPLLQIIDCRSILHRIALHYESRSRSPVPIAAGDRDHVRRRVKRQPLLAVAIMRQRADNSNGVINEIGRNLFVLELLFASSAASEQYTDGVMIRSRLHT
jgi:hypothetical protein